MPLVTSTISQGSTSTVEYYLTDQGIIVVNNVYHGLLFIFAMIIFFITFYIGFWFWTNHKND